MAVLPFPYFFGKRYDKDERYQLLYLFKLFRLKKVFQLLDPRAFKNLLKDYHRSKMKKKLDQLKDKKKFAVPSRVDHNYIMR